eukprot:CAMPEP_0194077716 /NCGR_PEP_ID=MMETSP0149-20130528/4297_1 /TAXON_ID=122233 /ORGANISM="Chaetoceros debilis, Strain MM31A-1" /LENGTH=1562 /DNA_ID=CAMNT_0038758825 /DNA_START=182 /DNA_END=4870 /DNA_ORIENTATION=-
MNPPNPPNHPGDHMGNKGSREMSLVGHNPRETLGANPVVSLAASSSHSVPFPEMQDKKPTGDTGRISTYNGLGSETAKTVDAASGDVIMNTNNNNNNDDDRTAPEMASNSNAPPPPGNNKHGLFAGMPSQFAAAAAASAPPTVGTSGDFNFGNVNKSGPSLAQAQPLNIDTNPYIPAEAQPDHTKDANKPFSAAEIALRAVHQFRNKASMASAPVAPEVGAAESRTMMENANAPNPANNPTANNMDISINILANSIPKEPVQMSPHMRELQQPPDVAMQLGGPPRGREPRNELSPPHQQLQQQHQQQQNLNGIDQAKRMTENNPSMALHPGNGDGNPNMRGMIHMPPHVMPPQQQQQQPPQAQNPPMGGGTAMIQEPSPGPFGLMRELKVEDALNYLDQVKVEFGSRPRIYNEFLEIMKNFKAQELDTPGVIMRVSDLFRGYNNLILGFNTFLPDGFKISIKDLEEGGRYASKKPHVQNIGPNGSHIQQQGPPRPGGQGFMGMGGGQQMHAARRPGQMHPQPPMHGNRPNFPGMPSGLPNESLVAGDMQRFKQNQNQGIQPPPLPSGDSSGDVQMGGMQQQQPQNAQDPGQQDGQHQAVEFDHAITYVTTIKKRFATEPRTYQQFLEILHTYQKEQRGIREVLEQVSSLFADHPDLLREFTYFLPEAVQEQAKERLQLAAAKAEARQAAARERALEASKQYSSNQFQANQAPAAQEDDQEIIDMTKKKPAVETTSAPTTSPQGQRKRPHSPSSVPLQYPIVPETMIYSAGVERQFFDMAKEALRSSSRDGEMAWAEFLKCMHYYAQEILSKNDLLRYMEDLLGKQHTDLFEEFKRILAAAGAPGARSHDDAWHSVPLSEIDFSRCRRCTPSYRALPRDYPVAPFSGRSDEEARVLNDVWISLPDGSEESYTFRHMRKNQHEEVLFRCEDERFEIDMVIDSNATALKRLEPIAEEIAMLQQKETIVKIDGKEKSGSRAGSDKGGLAGKTVKYSFDKRILNTIHRHAISRIYGDAGPEILDLMHKNPVVAVPVVVKRLRQKDKDFRTAREVLNRRWKELAEINYYKSIDHRSLTWRTIDKRATSTRTLIAEIKDRAANCGTESEPAVLVKKEKAKEEFGSFYERTMGHYLEKKMDLTFLPKPAPYMFTPHYSMKYENNSWAQRDAYRILSFALERGSISPGDKERSHRFWTDFLAPFFELSSIWMQSPAVAYATSPHHNTPSIISNNDDSGNEDEESSAEERDIIEGMMVTEEVLKKNASEAGNNYSLLDNQPIPPGTVVSTVYGEGIVIKYRHDEKCFVVSLPFGATAYLNRTSVLCTILPVDQFDLELSIPLTENDKLDRVDDKMILGPQSLYLFFRLHQVLVRRLNIARKLAFSVDTDQSLCTLIEQMEPDGSAPVGQKRYDAYLSLVYGLVEGVYSSSIQGNASTNTAEGGKYEDRVRCLLGHGAYELATMDKLVSHILKHLQHLANDDTMQGMVQIFRKQLDSGSFRPLAFRQEAAMISEGENVFAFQYCKIPKSDSTIMHVQLLGCITEDDEDSDKASLTGGDAESNDGPEAKRPRTD